MTTPSNQITDSSRDFDLMIRGTPRTDVVSQNLRASTDIIGDTITAPAPAPPAPAPAPAPAAPAAAPAGAASAAV